MSLEPEEAEHPVLLSMEDVSFIVSGLKDRMDSIRRDFENIPEPQDLVGLITDNLRVIAKLERIFEVPNTASKPQGFLVDVVVRLSKPVDMGEQEVFDEVMSALIHITSWSRTSKGLDFGITTFHVPHSKVNQFKNFVNTATIYEAC